MKVSVDGTGRGAEGAFRHIGIAVGHATRFLKRGRGMVDCLKKACLPGEKRQQKKNGDKDI